jgi:hypothetical protein
MNGGAGALEGSVSFEVEISAALASTSFSFGGRDFSA